MVGLVVWCMMNVTITANERHFVHETAVKGRVVIQNKDVLTVDFYDYAHEKDYDGDWYAPRKVHKDLCTTE